jgi:esterase/lipase
MTKDECLSLFADVNFKFDQFNQSKKDHLDGLKDIAKRLIDLNNMFFRNDDSRFRLKHKQIEELQSLSKQYEENLGQLEKGMDEIAQVLSTIAAPIYLLRKTNASMIFKENYVKRVMKLKQ